MLPRSPDWIFTGLALLGAAVACGLAWFVGWAAPSAFGLVVLVVAHRLDRPGPKAAPAAAGGVIALETYAIQLANKRKVVGLPNFARLAYIARTIGFALLAVGIYMLIRQQV
jgi:hypothetical protein